LTDERDIALERLLAVTEASYERRAQLQHALDSRVRIEQAKGVLAARSGISLAEAFTRMRSHARRHGLALTDVARSVVEGTADQTVLQPT